MVGLGTDLRVYLACDVTDMGKRISGLVALAKTELRQHSANGAVFAFQCRHEDRVKLLYWLGFGKGLIGNARIEELHRYD